MFFSHKTDVFKYGVSAEEVETPGKHDNIRVTVRAHLINGLVTVNMEYSAVVHIFKLESAIEQAVLKMETTIIALKEEGYYDPSPH